MQVEAWRACALWKTGREADAQLATTKVLPSQAVVPSAAMTIHLCRGDIAGGKALVLARMKDEGARDWALLFVQPA